MEKVPEVNRIHPAFFVVLLLPALLVADQERDKSLGFPYFRAVTPAYPTSSADSVRLDAIVKVPYDAIQFVKEGARFQAQYELSVSVQSMEGTQVDGKIWTRKVETERYKETISSDFFELEKASFILEPETYRSVFELKDMDTHKSGKQTFVVDLSRFGDETVLSDLLLVDPRDVSDAFPYGVPRIPPEISDGQSVFNILFELRSPSRTYTLTTRVVSIKDEVLMEQTDTSRSQGEISARVVPYQLGNIRENRFKIILEAAVGEARSKGELVIDVRWGGLTTHVGDIEKAIQQIRYIATPDESSRIRRAKGAKQEELFKEFWKERDPTPNTPANELMDEYYRRVEYANEKFGAFQEGWRTDMGMIFILFGPPDDVEMNLFARDGRSYQTWHYYVINRSFVFVDYNGFGEYELLEPYYSPYGYPRR